MTTTLQLRGFKLCNKLKMGLLQWQEPVLCDICVHDTSVLYTRYNTFKPKQ